MTICDHFSFKKQYMQNPRRCHKPSSQLIASMHAQLHQRTRSNNIHAHAQLHQHSNIHTHARLARNTNFILAIAFLGAGRGREYGSMSNSRACHVKHHAS